METKRRPGLEAFLASLIERGQPVTATKIERSERSGAVILTFEAQGESGVEKAAFVVSSYTAMPTAPEQE